MFKRSAVSKQVNKATRGSGSVQGLFHKTGRNEGLVPLSTESKLKNLRNLNSRPLKSAHLRDIARKQYLADFFNKSPKNPHGSFEVVRRRG